MARRGRGGLGNGFKNVRTGRRLRSKGPGRVGPGQRGSRSATTVGPKMMQGFGGS
jgi:hypothetical protein